MSIKTKKIVLVIMAIVLVALTLSAIILLVNNNQQEDENMGWMIDRDKFFYAGELSFQFRLIDGNSVFWVPHIVLEFVSPNGDHFNPALTELVFVHNEEEAQAFPDNVVVAWPRVLPMSRPDGEFTFSEGIVRGIQWTADRTEEDLDADRWTNRSVVTLEQFGLTHPLTVADLVDNWEKVNELWNAFGMSEQQSILNAAPYGGLPWQQ